MLIAGGPAPNNSRVTRRKHLLAVFSSRNFIWGLALVGGGGFLLLAALKGDPLIAGAAPAAVFVFAAFMAWQKAGKLAARDFFYGYALNNGFTYTPKLTLMEATPLLGAGDKRHCKHYMEGPLGDIAGVHAGLAHYTYETIEERTGRRKSQTISVYTPHNFTICVVELQRALTTFPGVFLRARSGFFGGDDWLDVSGLKSVELESSSLASKYKLKVRNNQNMTRLLELFQPSFQVWLSELPMQMFFEFSGGTLVTYVPKQLTDTTSLDILFATTERIAKRILKEGEPLKAVPTSAIGRGDKVFPMPPPATKPLIEGVPIHPITPPGAPPVGPPYGIS